RFRPGLLHSRHQPLTGRAWQRGRGRQRASPPPELGPLALVIRRSLNARLFRRVFNKNLPGQDEPAGTPGPPVTGRRLSKAGGRNVLPSSGGHSLGERKAPSSKHFRNEGRARTGRNRTIPNAAGGQPGTRPRRAPQPLSKPSPVRAGRGE